MKKISQMNRRQFVSTSLAASAGIATGIHALSLGDQKKKSDIKVGCTV